MVRSGRSTVKIVPVSRVGLVPIVTQNAMDMVTLWMRNVCVKWVGVERYDHMSGLNLITL